MEREIESYGPDREWSTSTNAGELNLRTYIRDRTDMRLGTRIEAKPLTHARHLKRHN